MLNNIINVIKTGPRIERIKHLCHRRILSPFASNKSSISSLARKKNEGNDIKQLVVKTGLRKSFLLELNIMFSIVQFFFETLQFSENTSLFWTQNKYIKTIFSSLVKALQILTSTNEDYQQKNSYCNVFF